MASKFSAFMAQNVEKIENKKIVVSNRFKDENGNPIEWEIRAISQDENDALLKTSYVTLSVPGKPGAVTRELDDSKYTGKMLSASVVYPDLNDAELQDSYGVKTPDALLKKMLIPGEMGVLAEAVAGFNRRTEGDLVEEAKN